jgi:hypothetical protein
MIGWSVIQAPPIIAVRALPDHSVDALLTILPGFQFDDRLYRRVLKHGGLILALNQADLPRPRDERMEVLRQRVREVPGSGLVLDPYPGEGDAVAAALLEGRSAVAFIDGAASASLSERWTSAALARLIGHAPQRRPSPRLRRP